MISVVVPIYNVEEYLPHCLRSIMAQSFADWECVLVDDGSTDSCSNICDDIARQDRRFKVVHKKNGGLSDARNVGMATASGDWIFFVDSDDWICSDCLMKLMDFAEKEKCDVVQCGFMYAYDDHVMYREPASEEKRHCVLSNIQSMSLLIDNDRVKNFAWGKLYRASIIKDIPFIVGKFFEDSFWQHLVFERVSNYGIIDDPLYYYRQRSTSISGGFSERSLDLLEGYEQRVEFIFEKYPTLYSKMLKKYWNVVDEICAIGNKSGIESYAKYYETAKVRYDYNKFHSKFDFMFLYLNKIRGRVWGAKYIVRKYLQDKL